ncbi:MAG: Ig-like domain-containing protein [Actinomycetota bacterium]
MFGYFGRGWTGPGCEGTRRPDHRLAVALSLIALLVTLLPAGASAAPANPQKAQFGPRAEVEFHSGTGTVRFIGTSAGAPIRRPAAVNASDRPASIARAFLDRYEHDFGLRDQAAELLVDSVDRVAGGRSVVRFQQLHRSVPVLGGELTVNLDPSGNLLSASGEIVPSARVATAPQVRASAARRAARAAVTKTYGVPTRDLAATPPELWIYDSRILGGPGRGVPTLVWRTEVTGEATRPIDELVLVDAGLGSVALHFSQIAWAKNRVICDANSTATQLPCVTPVRSEGDPPSAIQDVNDAYDFAGDTYDFYAGLGRDSIDDAGMPLVSTVRYCPNPASCPYQNAFWNGEQMVYGEGFAVDDVVGHELAHGVTEFGSHLFYYFQSGAINESLSDVFGEFVDLTNGAGTDTAATRWQIGEDIPGIGAIRDMEDPTLFGDPDRMTSPHYTADPNETDLGGVHSNSGVNNKATFLITDGGTFNGQTVTGLGIPKASMIYYEVQTNLLTSASDYADLADALPQACNNLVGTGGITAGDCVEVADAVAAVEMDVMPPAAPNPEAPVCPAGQDANDLFFDDLENPASGNWAQQTASGSNTWFYPQNSNPYGFDATFATSGTTNLWGYNQPSTADYSIAMTSSVAIPAASTAFLRFDHSFGFEDDATSAYDGGVLEYSTNAGVSWNDAGALPSDNGYTGTISSSFGNPLGGRNAFVRESNGYISSRFDVSSLDGQSVRFRFRIGTDPAVDDYGWFVDDVHIYTCSAGANSPPIALDDTLTTPEDTPGTVDVLANDSDPDGDPLTVTASTQGADGTVACTAGGECTYTPDPGFTGADSFDYTIEDGNGGSDSAIVDVTVTSDCEPVVRTLSNGDPDTQEGALEVTVDGLGAFGSSVVGDAMFNPPGTAEAAGTVFSSNVFVDALGRMLEDDCAAAQVEVISESATQLVTRIALDDLRFDITQEVTPIEGGASSQLTQRYEIENLAGSAQDLVLVRHVDGDLHFDGSIEDGGAASADGSVLYEFDASDDPASPSTFVGIAGALGMDAIPDRWTIQAYDYRDDIVDAEAIPAADDAVVFNDTDGDRIVDTPFDVTLSQQWNASVGAGATASFTTETNFGHQAPNQPPDAVNDTLTTPEDTPGTVDVLANDSDPDGDPLTVTASTQGADGTVDCTAGGECTYTPDPGFSGADDFDYTIEDGRGGSDSATVNVTVTPATNSPPLALDDTLTTPEDTPGTVNVLANDSDPDGDTLTITSFTQGGDGTVGCAGNSCTYTPDADYHGPDSFTYTIGDGNGGSDTATVEVTVTPVNDDPVAQDDSLTTPEDTPGTVDVLANDSDVDGDPLTVTASTQGADGTVDCTAGGECTYTPDPGFTGADDFDYTIEDGNGGSDSATVDVTVTPSGDTEPPNTKITKGPKGKVKKKNARKVKFKFTSTEPNSTFECKMDNKPWKPCESPKVYKKLKLGKHIFKVRATDEAGNTDPTPAKRKFKIVRNQRR